MDVKKARSPEKVEQHNQNEMPIRKGPWTVHEDTILVNYIATHGEGHWNSLARSAGLRRSGKSCRLRWLNYLRPDVRRGNMTLEEQILILDLQCRWGNRWSKIAQHLPGRTDNEIKNYWRTRVIKQAKQLKYDVNSKQFRDTLRYVWMPRMLERLQPISQTQHPNQSGVGGFTFLHHQNGGSDSVTEWAKPNHSYSDSSSVVPANSDQSDSSAHDVSNHNSIEKGSYLWPSFNNQVLLEQGSGGGESLESFWGDESMWFLQQLSDDSKLNEIKYNSLPSRML